jgi:hypothetical protein
LGAGAKRLEATLREMLAAGAAESHQSSARFVRRFVLCKTLWLNKDNMTFTHKFLNFRLIPKVAMTLEIVPTESPIRIIHTGTSSDIIS